MAISWSYSVKTVFLLIIPLVMLLILVPKDTKRLQYTMQLILTRLLGLDFITTNNPEDFFQHDGAKFSYGVQTEKPSLFFAAHPLLFESTISAKVIHHIDFEGNKAIFPVNDRKSALPFDLFAASFYLVSRYEEYLPHLHDSHNRYLASGSDAFQNGYLQKPLINMWSLKIRDIFKERFKELVFRTPVFNFKPSIDVDAAFAFRSKGLTRAIGGFWNSLQNKDFNEIKQRIKVLLRLERDPFDTFALQLQLQKKYHYRAIYFWLLADYAPNDKNIPYNNRHFQNLIRLLADYAEMGIHPSYASSAQPSLMEMETARLSKILQCEVISSRQHFLRLTLPETYRNLINNDIGHDYSMGYAEVPGFRASICTPFPFYDLDQDLPTNLMVHPFAVMDGTLKDYLNLSPRQAIEMISLLIEEVKSVGGTFIPLWHNHSLSNVGEWYGWLDVYLKMIEEAVSN